MELGPMKAKIAGVIALFSMSIVLSSPRAAQAAEGGASLYLPGGAGDILIALSPAPGLQVAESVFIQTGSADRAVLQGAVNLGLDVDVVLDLVGASYTFDKKVLGGAYSVGALLAFGSASLDATLVGPDGGSIAASADSFNLADTAFVPLQLNWSFGKLHLKFAEVIIAPTGAYDVNKFVNLGRNYWAFDTVLAVTYFNMKTGTEFSFAPGIMSNTKNSATDYRTGNEFHADFTVNQFLSETFAVGLRGYVYNQVTGDSGSGAILGDFKSESVGIGPGIFWKPKFAGGKFVLVAKYMHDVQAKNRIKSDYVTVAVAWKF